MSCPLNVRTNEKMKSLFVSIPCVGFVRTSVRVGGSRLLVECFSTALWLSRMMDEIKLWMLSF